MSLGGCALAVLEPGLGVSSMQPISWMVAVGLQACFALSAAMGSNDVANAFGTPVGAKILSLRNACILAAIFDVAGALTLGVGVSNTIAAKIVDPATFEEDSPALFALGMLSASIAATLVVAVATGLAVPVSTTHAVVGAVIGFSFTETTEGLIWFDGTSGLGAIVMSWVLSPVLSGLITAGLYLVTRSYVLRATPIELALERQRRLSSVATGWIVAMVVFFVAYAVTESGTQYDWVNAGIALCCLFAITALMYFCLMPWVLRTYFPYSKLGDVVFDGPNGISEATGMRSTLLTAKVDGFDAAESETDPSPISPRSVVVEPAHQSTNEGISEGDRWDPQIEERFNILVLLGACFMAFTHGANDISNAAGPMVAIWSAYTTGRLDVEVNADYWIVVVACIGVVTGLAIWGKYVIATVGSGLTTMTASRAYCIELGTATSVLLASFLSLPVSSTQCIIGAVVAVGLCNGEGKDAVNWLMVKKIVCSWVLTVPLAGIASAIIFTLLKPTISGVDVSAGATLLAAGGSECDAFPVMNSTYPVAFNGTR